MSDTLRTLLKGVGLRSTGSRITVLRAMHTSAKPLTHGQVMEAIGTADWDRASIYRVLSDLADAGLLNRFDPGDQTLRFELPHGPEADGVHVHFLCETCGLLVCLDSAKVNLGPLAPEIVGEVRDVQVSGVCRTCA